MHSEQLPEDLVKEILARGKYLYIYENQDDHNYTMYYRYKIKHNNTLYEVNVM